MKNVSLKLKMTLVIFIPVIILLSLFLTFESKKQKLVNESMHSYMDYLKDIIFMSSYDSLKKGNMVVFKNILEEIGGYDKVKEFSLLDPSGRVKYSSDKSLVDRVDGFKPAKDKLSINDKGDRLDYYMPVKTQEYCVRCHRDWELDTVNSYYKVSLDNSSFIEISTINTFANTLYLAIAIVSILVIFFGMRSLIFARLTRLRGLFAELAKGDGDLTKIIPVNRRDEIGSLVVEVNEFVGKLRDVIKSLQTAINNVSSDISGMNREVAGIVGEIQNNTYDLESISSSTDDISATLTQNIQHLGEMTVSVNREKNEIDASIKNFNKVVDMISEISGSVSRLGSFIRELEVKSSEIDNIILMINDVADQTNMLALNAAIEAARAGEVGRGFAVVADEVRKLAEKTQNATADIKSIVTENSNLIHSIVCEIDDNQENAELMSGSVNQEITDFSGKITTVMSEISSNLNLINDTLQSSIASLGSNSHNIASLTSSLNQTNNSSQSIAQTVDDVSRKTEEMRKAAQTFKTD